jgi:hypothetical protein
MLLEADLVLSLEVKIGPIQEIGKNIEGFLNVIPITGGTFKCLDNEGQTVRGIVLPGGADWNTIKNENLSHAFAKYVIQTEDKVLISVENEGYMDNRADKQVIKTIPRFKVDDNSRYSHLNYGVFVGQLDFNGDKEPFVVIKVYKLK